MKCLLLLLACAFLLQTLPARALSSSANRTASTPAETFDPQANPPESGGADGSHNSSTVQPVSVFPELPRPPEPQQMQEDFHKTALQWTSRFLEEQAQREPRTAEELAPRNKPSLLERLIGEQDSDSCGVDLRQGPTQRDNLVLLPAGDGFNQTKWLDRPREANWDLVVLFYGSQPANFSCPQCRAVYVGTGPKWRLVYRFTLLDEWREMRQRYRALLIPDDDLTLDTCTINTLFSTLAAYDLLMAQPSLCPVAGSFTPWRALYQNPSAILRFTTFIEIMAPLFRMDLFEGFIRPTLHNAHVGWGAQCVLPNWGGLDFVWPFMLHYPRDRIAVIDQVCMYHPASSYKPNSVYAAPAPYLKKEEETRRFAEWEYFDSEIHKRGFWYQAVEVLGLVPRPPKEEGLLQTSTHRLQERLGPLFPVLLFGQSLLIVSGCVAVTCVQVWWRRRRGRAASAQFKASS